MRHTICLVTLTILSLLTAVGCDRDTSGLQPAPLSTDPIVFMDNFGDQVDYQAFLGSWYYAISVDADERYEGSASLKVVVPDASNPDGGWAGGALVTTVIRDLSGYDALTFWAKSSVPSTLDVAGLANDNTGNSKYEASWANIELTADWTKYVIPIPLPEKLALEGGLFYFAEGAESPGGHVIWFDSIRFETVGTISNPRPSMTAQAVNSFVGATINVVGTQTIFDVAGTDQTIQHLPDYFTYTSSNQAVATVVNGEVRVVGGGTATITATLGTVSVNGEITVTADAPPNEGAPTPTVPAGDVISIFSNAYTDITVDTWSADWDQADVDDLRIGNDDVKAYTNLVFAGIEFASTTIDASSMTHFHLDVWVTDGAFFKVKLVDFGEDGTYGGAPDSEHELTFNASTTPAFAAGEWASLDIPLTDFTRLRSTAHLAQLIISADRTTAYVDNVYLHR